MFFDTLQTYKSKGLMLISPSLRWVPQSMYPGLPQHKPEGPPWRRREGMAIYLSICVTVTSHQMVV